MRLYNFGIVFCYLGYAWMASLFCKRQLKQFHVPKWLWITIFAMGIFLINHLSERGAIPYIMTAMLHHGFIGILILMGAWGGIGKKMLVTAVILLSKELIGHFSNSLFSCLTLVFLRLVQKEAIGFGWELDLVIGCLSFVVFFVILSFMISWIAPVFMGKPDKWYQLLSLPLFFLLFLIDIVNWGVSNGVMVVSYKPINHSVLQNQIFSHGAICLLMALCFVLAGCVIGGLNKIYMGERDQERYKLQVSFYEMLTEQYDKQERLRHDMKNHILCLQELWNESDWERLGRYLCKMQNVGALGEEEWSGSKIMDVLLYSKKKQAEGLHIFWMCDVSASFGISIEEFDLCILIGNLLDNALQAAGRTPDGMEAFICIQAQKRNGYSLLVVKNSTELKELRTLEEGIGLANVRRVIQQYGGTIRMQLVEYIFSVSVLLPETLPDMTAK